MITISKRYLGDGVYIEPMGEGVVLTTEDGLFVTNTIVLEAAVLTALLAFVRALQARH